MVKITESSSPGRIRKNSLSFLLLLAMALFVRFAAAQEENGPPQVGEGSLIYRLPDSSRYEFIPLLHTDVALDVRGLVAAATVTQQFANSGSIPLEAVYVFPLPHAAAVYDMEIRIGRRIIRSVIREREEAKHAYETARSEGKRAALLEQERPNIFTASIANIMPGDRIAVRMRYVEPLKWERGNMRLVFPMVVGPRYIPGTSAIGKSGTGWSPDTDAVADASRITPPVRNPENRPGHDLSLSIDLDSGFSSTKIKSVSHAVKLSESADGRLHVELERGATIPNKDLILQIDRGANSQPKTALFLSPEDSGETHFLLAAFPPTAPPVDRVPVEMLYMIDVSGSMEGTSIAQAREALLQALDRLRPIDRFAILAFNSGYREFSPFPLQATAMNLEAARRFVNGLYADSGTEMLPALLHLMQKPAQPGYLHNIVLLTDGDLGNEEQIFSALHAKLGNTRLYTIAIGSAPNLFLATKMARLGRGTFTHISDPGEISERMTGLFEMLENPVLTDITLSFDGISVDSLYPQSVPDLFLNQPLLVYGRILRGRAGRIHLNARAGNRSYEETIDFNVAKAKFHPGITTLWARQRVEDLMDAWRHAEENEQANIRTAVIEHAIRYHLVTRFTSLIAIEEVVANPGGNSNSVAVPTELPAGWKMDNIFGSPATGTADDFFEALGLALLLTGTAFWYAGRRKGVLQ
ncbi:MAG: marine proteobacterial sortase target protein [Acidobacteria bacterium]|nr:marine proteobacterial sortase target protein [Acidobacteriota bacterium]